MLIKWWQGTDALKLYMYPPGEKKWYIRIFLERIFWRIFHRFFIHWVNTKKIIPYLNLVGIKEAEEKPMPYNTKKYKKVKHQGVNIVYYLPKRPKNMKYKNWIYGKNIIGKIKQLLPDCNFIHLDGNVDMATVFPYADVYIKINRHPGSDLNRLGKEFLNNNITVYQTDYTASNQVCAEMFVSFVKKGFMG